MKKKRIPSLLSGEARIYRKKKIVSMWAAVLLAAGMTGCGQNGEIKDGSIEAEAASDSQEHASECSVTLTEGKYSEEKLDDSWEEESSVQIELNEDKITVKTPETEQEADDTGVEILENQAVITQAGTYLLSGTLKNGQIVIDADKEEMVRLVLNGAELNCTSSAPIYSKGGNVVIILAEGTENAVTDGTNYLYGEGEDEPTAVIFAKDDLTFNGTGTLSVTGNYDHAIQCKDDLKFITGTYVIKALGDGIVGKDSVTVKNGNFTIESGDDGIKATNTEESDKGYVLIEDGSFQITAGKDGIQAETLLRVNDGNMEIISGGGSQNAEPQTEFPAGGGRFEDKVAPSDGQKPDGDRQREGMMQPEEGMFSEDMPDGQRSKEGQPDGKMEPPDGRRANEEQMGERMAPSDEESPDHSVETQTNSTSASESTKALKSYVELIIAGGEFDLDSCDDGIHSDRNVTIKNGSFVINSGDDGIHADQTLTIENGELDIQKSYEGLEGFEIVIDGGNMKILASDDGINAAGDDGSRQNPEADEADAQIAEDGKANPDQTAASEETGYGRHSGDMGKGARNPMPEEDQGAVLTVNGGTVYVSAGGDGLDANGDIFINGGDITVHGPADGGNGTLDYASSCKITGGMFWGIGSLGMAQNPSEDSTQSVIVWRMDAPVEAGTLLVVKDREGNVITEKETEKTAQWFAVSSEDFKGGETYMVCAGDTVKEVKLSQTVTMAE